MPIKYIGRTSNFSGKTLWEILGNLKGFGVGRIVARSLFERYPEPSFMKIVKVETLPEPKDKALDNARKVKVIVERTFRGEKSEQLVTIESSSYKGDYKLIPKSEEATYCRFEKPKIEQKILPRTMAFPPLMRDFLIREKKLKGETTEEPVMQIVYNRHVFINKKSSCRIAKEGETPTIKIDIGLGTPSSLRLYKGLKL